MQKEKCNQKSTTQAYSSGYQKRKRKNIAAETDSGTTSTGDLGANLALTATAKAAYTNTYGISTKKINDGTLATPDASIQAGTAGAQQRKSIRWK